MVREQSGLGFFLSAYIVFHGVSGASNQGSLPVVIGTWGFQRLEGQVEKTKT
jgi:hypothetical protein